MKNDMINFSCVVVGCWLLLLFFFFCFFFFFGGGGLGFFFFFFFFAFVVEVLFSWHRAQELLWKSRWTSWATSLSPVVRSIVQQYSAAVKQHLNDQRSVAVPPVDGRWSVWSGWSSCTKDCNGGIQTRRRNCNQPRPSRGGQLCNGNKQEWRMCNTQKCDGEWLGCLIGERERQRQKHTET